MNVDCKYGFGKQVDYSFSAALERVTGLLSENGFTIHSRIDMRAVFCAERTLPFNDYIILGACRQDFAERAFNADHNIGLLLPCNVIVYEELSGEVVVMVKDPIHIMDLVSKPTAIEVAIEVKSVLESIISKL